MVASTAVVVRDNAWQNADRRVSVFNRIDGPSTSDGRGFGRNDGPSTSDGRQGERNDGPSTSDGRGRGGDRSFSPVRSAVYTNSRTNNDASWAEADRQLVPAASTKDYKLSWNLLLLLFYYYMLIDTK